MTRLSAVNTSPKRERVAPSMVGFKSTGSRVGLVFES